MELSPERIRSLIDEVTRELGERGVLPAGSGARTADAAATRAPGGARGPRAPGGGLGVPDYGNVAGRPGGYCAGYAGSYGVGPGSPGSAAHVPTEAADTGRGRNRGPLRPRGVFRDLDGAVRAAREAHRALVALPLHVRAACLEAIRAKCRDNVHLLAELAVSETGMGRVADKVQKNLLVINQTPGIEDLEPHVYSGDHGLTLTEWAPFGVIGAAGPSTNPSETVINNGIGMLAGGNAVVFAPHPSARRTCQTTIALVNEAAVEAGGPDNVITTVEEPTIESAQAMMRHAEVRLLVVTGGPGVVREAMASGKKVIAAGPGNPPVVVDETADLVRAGRDIVAGAALDNNIICTDEKETFVVEAAADALLAAMERAGAYRCSPQQIEQLRTLVLETDHGPRRHSVVNRRWVGRDAAAILAEIGVSVGPEVRLAVCEVPPDHPFVWTELLMPVFPVARVASADEAIEWAVAAEHGFRHTASIHSKNIERLSRMARRMDCSVFVKNGPNFAGLGMGGEGPTSFTIASPTGEGITTARSFTRKRRCTLVDYFRIV